MYLIVSFQHLDVPQLKHLNTEPGVQEAFCRLMEIDFFFCFQMKEWYTRTGVPFLCMAVINGKLWLTTGNFASLRH